MTKYSLLRHLLTCHHTLSATLISSHVTYRLKMSWRIQARICVCRRSIMIKIFYIFLFYLLFVCLLPGKSTNSHLLSKSRHLVFPYFLQVIEWMKKPTPLSEINGFGPWSCQGGAKDVSGKQAKWHDSLASLWNSTSTTIYGWSQVLFLENSTPVRTCAVIFTTSLCVFCFFFCFIVRLLWISWMLIWNEQIR